MARIKLNLLARELGETPADVMLFLKEESGLVLTKSDALLSAAQEQMVRDGHEDDAITCKRVGSYGDRPDYIIGEEPKPRRVTGLGTQNPFAPAELPQPPRPAR